MILGMKKRPIEIGDLYKLVYLGDPQMSPDHQLISFTKKVVTKKHKYETQICTYSLKSKEIKQWTQGDKGNGMGRWSPDGKKLAFISGRDGGKAQIYLLAVDGGEASQLTHFPEGSLGGFKWSPDGTKMAVVFRETEKAFTEEAKKKRESEGGATPPLEIDTEWYREDGDGYFGNQRFRLYLVDAVSGEHSLLHKGSALGDYTFSWHPNGKELVVGFGEGKHPLRAPANDQFHRIKLDGTATKISDQPKGGKWGPQVSPDGKWLAYIGNVDETDGWGTRNSRIFLTSIDGGAPTCLTTDDIDFASGTLGDTKEPGAEFNLFWMPDGKSLISAFAKHGEEQIAQVGIDGKVKVLTKGDHVLIPGNLANDGSSIPVIYHSFEGPGELAMVHLKSGAINHLTDLNHDWKQSVEIAIPEAIWVDSTDGAKVQAWVVKPLGFKAGKKHAAILEIHGGPHAQYGKTFFHEFQVLAAQGYVVVFSNPRGSKGYGEEFCRAIFRSWGEKDWQDVQAVRDWMKAQTFIDKARLGVMGGSYGGYMTNWVIGHCHDFAGAITDRCVSNFVSMSGSSDYPLNPNGYFGGIAYGDLEDIKELWRQSPIAYFKGVKTPTLVIHSVGDLRCNIEQSEQVFYALKMQNVPSRFVRYPVETSHGLSRSGPPDLRMHRLNEIVTWWSKWLKG